MAATDTDLFGFLDALGIPVETHEHAPVFTVGESGAVKAGIPGAHSKNLFLKDRKGRLFLVAAGHETAIDLKRLGPLLGATGRLSFGSPDLLLEVLGVRPGSVTAFAALNDTEGRVAVILDAALVASERVNAHPLRNTATTGIASADLLRFLRATGHEPRILALPAPDCAGPAAHPSL
jgi:Ala-tRNA(Pro) deacylase